MKPPPVCKTPPTEKLKFYNICYVIQKKATVSQRFQGVDELNCCGQLPQLSGNLGPAISTTDQLSATGSLIAFDLPLGSTPHNPKLLRVDTPG